MRQSRIRHARREFSRAFPQIAQQMQDANQRAARKFVWAATIRNALITLGVLAAVAWRCATW